MPSLRFSEFTVDPATGEMAGPAGREQLDPKVMQVLAALARKAGVVVSRDELLEQVWPGVVVGDDVVSRCIYQLRQHLKRASGDDRHAALVETLPKRGYRMNCTVTTGSTVDPVRKDIPPPRPDPRESQRATLPWRRIGGWIAVALAAAAAAGVWFVQRNDYFWRNPLVDARFTRVTDFEGVERGVGISRDGRSVVFLASRDGPRDAWIGRLGSGEFRNLTQGLLPPSENPTVRTVGFNPDASLVTLWTRQLDRPGGTEKIDTWAVNPAGGRPHPYLDDVAEVAWSPDGRMVYHPAAPGDPLFVSVPGQAKGRQIYIASPGIHCHYPVWSPDGKYIYFVRGRPPDEMDVWRIPAAGGTPERITSHNAYVAYPVMLDARKLLYLAKSEDGSGPWIYAVDVERRIGRRISPGLEQYTSLAASGDGRRLVATRSTPMTSLWRVPLLDRVAVESDVARVRLPTAGGRSPRFGPGYLLYVSDHDGGGLRKLVDGTAVELWNGRAGRIDTGPAIDRAIQRIAFVVGSGKSARLYVTGHDGTRTQALAEGLAPKGSPAWSPDGQSLFVAADAGRGEKLYKVPLDGSAAVPLLEGYARDAVWSPDGRFLAYGGAETGPSSQVQAVSADGRPYPLPPLALQRGARRLAFLPDGQSLVLLKGDAHDRNFWKVDLATGEQRLLTRLAPGYSIADFDVSADGREIVFDRARETTDVVSIDLAR